MKHSQMITGGPSYSRDLWDNHGIKVITERIEKSKKSMKLLRDFFQDAANMSFRNAQTTHKLQTLNLSQAEFGTLKFIEDRYCELIETMSKNEEILGSKIRTQCYQKLNDQISRISKVNTKLLSDLQSWQKSLEREQKKLRKAKANYDQKKELYLTASNALTSELEQLQQFRDNPSMASKVSAMESNIATSQSKVKALHMQSREALEQYIKAVSVYRGFRTNYDSSTSTILENLEQTECDRAQMLHRVLKLYLEIQQVMVQQSLRNIDTISKHIANIDAHSDNMIFVEKYRSSVKRPPLPDPKFHPDDEEKSVANVGQQSEDSVEQSAEVRYWSEKWRLVFGKILERDMELISPKNGDDDGVGGQSNGNGNSKPKEKKSEEDKDNESKEKGGDKEEDFAFIQLTNEEYAQLRATCVNSLSSKAGRFAFSLIVNRQRNTEYGLELKREQFLGLVDIILLFLDAVQNSQPLDIKPAKLVMIMSQSLYVQKEAVMDLLTESEKKEFEQTSQQNLQKKLTEVETNKNDENDAQEEEESTNNNKQTHSSQLSTVSNTSYLPKKNKLFIVDRIKHHELWKNDKFWKEAYCDSVQQEILKYPTVKKWHSESEQQEADRREQQIIFSQLAAWTHNMKEFGTDDEKILNFLDSRGLKPEQVDVLKMTLQLNGNESVGNNNENMKGDKAKDVGKDSDDKNDDNDNGNELEMEHLNSFEIAADSVSVSDNSTGLP